jgi:hypothetical protein
MSTDILLSPIPLDQLKGIFSSIVRDELRAKEHEDLAEKLLSPEEACKLFMPAISIATLNNYSKEGLVQKHYLGRLTFYKYSELIGSLKDYQKI